MAFELVYTSAPHGLKQGSTGFCTVACTRGMSARQMVQLEGLSTYKPVFAHYEPNAWENPVSCFHYISSANAERWHILGRSCFNGVDHTNRSNMLASYILLNDSEASRVKGGGASLFKRNGMFKDADWTIKTEFIPSQAEIPEIPLFKGKCSAWETVAGDAG